MKQGSQSGSNAGRPKVEPKANAIRPSAVSHIGVQQGTHITDRKNEVYGAFVDMNKGRGFMSPPPDGKTIHPSGSQGKRR